MSASWTSLLFVMGAVSLLCATEAARFNHQGRTSAPRVNRQQECKPPRGYRRFHANDSLVGSPVRCTRDDKICFRYNLMFDPELGRCEPIGGGRHGGCDLRVNRTEFEHGSRRILGVCRTYMDPCPGYRMAYDDRCYPKRLIDLAICGRCAFLTRHLLGGVECRTRREGAIKVQQPKEDGRCVIPDLRYPDKKRSKFNTNTPNKVLLEKKYLRCGTKQFACFSKGKVSVSGYQGCHELLQRGPCPADHVVAVDIKAARSGQAITTCVHVRGGCPRGHKRMLFDGQCHEDRELAIAGPGSVHMDKYGQYMFVTHGFSFWWRPETINKFCHFAPSGVGPARSELVPKPLCGANDRGLCRLYEVEAVIPLPDDD